MASVPTTSAANGNLKLDASVAKPAAAPVPNGTGPKHVDPPKIKLTADQIVTYLFYAFLVWLLLLFKLFRPSIWTLLWYLLWGTAAGAGGAFMYFKQIKRKEELREVLGFDPGMKGLKFLCGDLPTWISLTEREKVNWLNHMLEELWPFYDKAVCDTVKSIVEPMMDSMKPPGVIKAIKFKNLTFGTAPFRIEDLMVVEELKDEVLLEVNIRWAGDANITMAVDLPAGGDLTRMCPKVTDMSFMGTARISLRPLIDTIPCFGFAMVSFRRPPLIKYKLDFGRALGGSTAANGIKAFIEPFIEDYLVNAFVWPNRYLVPIVVDEKSAREMEKLQLRDVGIMRIRVTKAKNLKAYDMNGKSDPMVTMWIDPLHRVHSKTVKSSLNPEFGDEEFFLLVQEPKDQYLRLEMYDVDFFNAEKLAGSWKVWNSVGKAFYAKTLMGRSLINMKDICAVENQEKAAWYPLGKNEWGDDDGPGKGEGEVHLKCCYRGFETFTSLHGMSTQGVLVVKVFQCSHVEMVRGQDFMQVHMVLKCNKEEYKSNPVRAVAIKEAGGTSMGRAMTVSSLLKKTAQEFCDPVFNIKYSFYDVDVALTTTVVKMKLINSGGSLAADDELGRFEAVGPDIRDARYAPPGESRSQQGRMNRNVALRDSSSNATMHFEIMFVPYF